MTASYGGPDRLGSDTAGHCETCKVMNSSSDASPVFRVPVVNLALATMAGLVLGTHGSWLGASIALALFLANEARHYRRDLRVPLCVLACASFLALEIPVASAAASSELPVTAGLVRIDGVLGSAARGQASDDFGVVRDFVVDQTAYALFLKASDAARLPAGRCRVRGLAHFSPACGGAKPRLDASAATLRYEHSTRRIDDVRAALQRRIRVSFAAASARVRGFVARLVFGRGELEDEDLRAHRVTGLAHLLAISGLHAVFVASLLRALLSIIGLRGRTAFACLVVVLVAYAWLCENRAPVVRAVSGYLIYRAAHERGRGTSLASVLAFAIVVNLLLFGESITSLSLQLSFAAVLGIALIGSLKLPASSHAGSRRDSKLRTKLGRGVARTLLVSFGAWLATAPLVLDAFGATCPWSIVWTPLAAPGVLLVLALAGVTAAAAVVVPGFAAAAVPLIDVLGTWQLDLVRAFADWQGPAWIATSFPPEGLAEAILVLGGTFALLSKRRAYFIGGLVAATLLYFLPTGSRHAPSSVTIHAVGHGQCVEALLEGRRIVIDCGDRLGGRIASRRLRASLRRSGRNHIDVLVLTHGDADHVAALAELSDSVRIGLAVLPDVPKLGNAFRTIVRGRIPLQLVSPGERLVAEGLILHAVLADADLAPSNEGGLVCDLRLSPSARVLVFGDHEDAGSAAAASALSGPVDAMVLPHHASIPSGASGTTAMTRLLESCAPRLTLASTATRSALDDRWSSAALRPHAPLRTGVSGTIRLEATTQGLRVLTGPDH